MAVCDSFPSQNQELVLVLSMRPPSGAGGPPEAKTASGEAPQQYNEVTLNTHSLSTQYYRFSGKEKRRREGRRPILSIYYIQY